MRAMLRQERRSWLLLLAVAVAVCGWLCACGRPSPSGASVVPLPVPHRHAPCIRSEGRTSEHTEKQNDEETMHEDAMRNGAMVHESNASPWRRNAPHRSRSLPLSVCRLALLQFVVPPPFSPSIHAVQADSGAADGERSSRRTTTRVGAGASERAHPGGRHRRRHAAVSRRRARRPPLLVVAASGRRALRASHVARCRRRRCTCKCRRRRTAHQEDEPIHGAQRRHERGAAHRPQGHVIAQAQEETCAHGHAHVDARWSCMRRTNRGAAPGTPSALVIPRLLTRRVHARLCSPSHCCVSASFLLF